MQQASGSTSAAAGDAPTGDAPTGDAPTGDAPTSGRARAMVGLAFLVLLLHALLLLRTPFVLRGELPDPDDAMRLVRVRTLLDGGGWYAGIEPRGNAPWGETLHWTRPQDVLIAGLALPLQLALGPARGLHVAGVIVSPLLHLLAVLAAGWAARPLARRSLLALAALTLLAQPLIVGFAAPGRADHHMLQMSIFLLGTGALLRVATAPQGRRAAWGLGALAALGVWVSVEMLLLSLFALGALTLLWIARGAPYERAARSVCLAQLLGLAAALALERPPSDWSAVETDRLSVAHLFAALVALLAFASVGAARVRRALDRPWQRVAAAVAGAALGLGLLRLVLPSLFRGPMSDAQDIMWSRWLDWIEEYQPLLVPDDLAGVGMFLKCIGPVLVCLPFALRRLAAERGRPAGPAWGVAVFGLLAFLPLSLYMIRFAAYAEILLALVLAVVADALADRLEGLQPRTLRLIVRPLAITALIPGFLFLGAIVEASAMVSAARASAETTAAAGAAGSADAAGAAGAAGSAEAAARDADGAVVDEFAGRTLGGLAALLSDPDGLGDRPRTVLAFTQYGPDLIYRTPHRAVTSPYHRNAAGLLDAHVVFTARDDREAREVIDARSVDLVLLCPVGPETMVHGIEAGDGSLYERLIRGAGPDWLRPVSLPEELAPTFRLYEVLPDVAGG